MLDKKTDVLTKMIKPQSPSPSLEGLGTSPQPSLCKQGSFFKKEHLADLKMFSMQQPLTLNTA